MTKAQVVQWSIYVNKLKTVASLQSAYATCTLIAGKDDQASP